MDFIYFVLGGFMGLLSMAAYALKEYDKGYNDGYEDAKEDFPLNKGEVAKLLKMRAYIYFCSYRTAWEQYMNDHERNGFTYEEVYEEIMK